MATPNNVTPTNCSWWPISALENDAGKSKEGEENQDPTDPALRSQDRLVLYHWTQSFSSQKVTARPASREESPRRAGHTLGSGGRLRSQLFPRVGEGSGTHPVGPFVPAFLCFISISPGRGGLSQTCFCFQPGVCSGRRLCFVLARSRTQAKRRQRLSRGPPCSCGDPTHPAQGAARGHSPVPGAICPSTAARPWKPHSKGARALSTAREPGSPQITFSRQSPMLILQHGSSAINLTFCQALCHPRAINVRRGNELPGGPGGHTAIPT